MQRASRISRMPSGNSKAGIVGQIRGQFQDDPQTAIQNLSVCPAAWINGLPCAPLGNRAEAEESGASRPVLLMHIFAVLDGCGVMCNRAAIMEGFHNAETVSSGGIL